jgi:hypothetical protein
LFPVNYCVFCADRVDTVPNITRGGGALTAVHRSFSGFKRRYGLELANEFVWIEIPIPNGSNLLTGTHYFPPNTDAKVIENYFNSLETNLTPQNFRVVLIGDFNFPGYDWINGFPQANSHYHTKLRGDIKIHNTACYLELSQNNFTFQNKKLLGLVFTNASDINICNS